LEGWRQWAGVAAARSPDPSTIRDLAKVRAALLTDPEAYGALVALGYRPAEATRLLKAVGPGTHSTEELIRRALQGAARE